MHRILFVEPHPEALTGLALLVSRDWAVRTVPNMLEATRLGPRFLPDLLVVDVPTDGVERHSILFHLVTDSPKCPVIVITADGRHDLLPELAGLRLEGLFSKPVAIDKLVACMVHAARLPRLVLHRSVAAAVEHIVARYAEHPTLRSVASAVGASRTHLAARFRRDTGMTMMVFLARFRVEVAKALLRTTDDKLDAIASSIGFCDASHFSRVFQSTTRTRHGLYRRQAS
ncbi:MAG: helix-turn-helix domain-containing protein [Candidatus Rokuibacteriota bacterium]